MNEKPQTTINSTVNTPTIELLQTQVTTGPTLVMFMVLSTLVYLCIRIHVTLIAASLREVAVMVHGVCVGDLVGAGSPRNSLL